MALVNEVTIIGTGAIGFEGSFHQTVLGRP
jgi:hypothetical protein